MIRKILVALLVILIVLQFFKPERNTFPQGLVSNNNISTKYAVPNDVAQIIKTSCADCHSNNTIYPWYANVQPVAWWLANHIKEGKKELNFDEFATYNLRKQYHKLESMGKEVEEDEMPLGSYTLIHQNAKLDDTQKKVLMDWATETRKKMEATYPMDSLIRKK